MKYYSEVLKKSFDSAQECLDAEKKHEEEKKNTELAIAEKKSAISKQKKELSDAISEADKSVDEAYKELEKAREDASKILKEARQQANEIVKAANQKVEEATATRRDCIAKFNKEFGPYMVTYTGNKAEEEYNRITKRFNNIFDSLFYPFNSFWF